MNQNPTFFPPRRWFALGILLALGHVLLATLATREKSTTADELVHVTAGYISNHRSDYRLLPDNGILPQRWLALPATWTHANSPALTTPTGENLPGWMVGYDFFYHRHNDPDRLLFGARAMNSLFGGATVLLVFLWSWRLWAAPGAVVAGIFCALCPAMLTQSGLATSDMTMAFCFLAATSAFWWQLQDGRKRLWLLSGALIGLAAAAKFSAVLLLPFALVMALVRTFQPQPLVFAGRTFRSRWSRAGFIAVSTVGQGLVAAFIVWAFFGFRFSAFSPDLPAGGFGMPWSATLANGGAKSAIIEFGRQWRLLPEAWLYGLSYVLHYSQGRAAFLDGNYGVTGWVDFFPRVFLYKTPPSLLVGLVAGALLAGMHARTLPWRQTAAWIYRVIPLLVLFGGYWLFSLTTHLNIGHRHILPTYPVLYIFVGGLGWAIARAWRQSRQAGAAGALVVASLLGWHAVNAATAYPHYLAYFSPLVGGPREGYRHLVDSSLDWGQDLPALRKWLDQQRRPGEAVYVAYFGADEPRRFLSDVVLLPRLPTFDQARPRHACMPGLYAISATLLQHVYRSQNAIWTESHEARYQLLRPHEAEFLAEALPPGGALQRLTPAEREQAWSDYEALRFARLCFYLRARQPDGYAGYSILIYRLSPGELADALANDLPTFQAAVARARASGN